MYLKYDVGIVGVRRIDRALTGIERRYRVHNQRVNRMGTGGVGGGGARRAAHADTALQRAEQKRHTATMRNISKEAAAKERADQRAAQKKERDDARAIAKRERMENRLHARMSKKRYAAEVAAAKAGEAARTRFARSTTGFVGRSVGGAVRGVGRLTLGALALGGGFAAHAAVGRTMSIDTQLRNLANQAYTEGEGPSREEFYNRFKTQATVAGKSGKGTLASVGAISAFGESTGAFDLGGQMAKRFADISMVSGADIGDVATTAAMVQMQLTRRGIDPKLGNTPEEKKKLGDQAIGMIDKVMMTLLSQGKAGSIEFKNFAQIMPEISAAAGQIKGMPIDEAIIQTAAFAQLAKTSGASTPAMAGTAMMRMMDDLVEKESWKKHGIDRYNYEMRGGEKVATGLSNPLELLTKAAIATKGDVRRVQELMGIRGRKGGNPVIDMISGFGKGDIGKGLKKFMKVYKPLTTPMGEKEFGGSREYAEAGWEMELARAKEDLMEAIGPKLAETIIRLIPVFESLVPIAEKGVKYLAEFIEGFAKNPWLGVAKIIGLLVVKDVAAAGIGMLLRGALAKALALAGLPALAPLARGGAAAGGAAAPGVLSTLAASPLAAGASALALPAAAAAGAAMILKGAVESKASPYGEGAEGTSGPERWGGAIGAYQAKDWGAKGRYQGAGGGRAEGGGGAGGVPGQDIAVEGGPELKDGALQLGVAAQALRIAAEHVGAIQGGMQPANTGYDPSSPRGPLTYRTGYEGW